ncbi:MAG: DNA polymerase III subunit delta [Cytophagales bacterium]|nr:MAG: DNA polymerase III subunit delta [Cytophagales bacterium]
MLQTPEAVLKELKQKKYKTCYLLHGEESYYIDVIAEEIEKNAISDAEKGFNQTILYGKDINVGVLMQQARRFPMMAEKQVVIVREFQQMPDLNKQEAKELLEKYAQNPLPTTILVLCHKHKTLNKNTTLYKNFEKYATVVETKKLKEDKVFDWIQEYLKSEGFSIVPKAANMLIESIGADMSRLRTEIDKLMISFGNTKTIDEKAVEENVGISREYNVFEFQGALAKKETEKVMRILQHWKSNPKSQPAIPTIAMLFQFFCKLLAGNQSVDKSDKGLSEAMGVPIFFVKDYKTALQKYSLNSIILAISAIRTADLKTKGIDSASIEDTEILRELTAKILYQ